MPWPSCWRRESGDGASGGERVRDEDGDAASSKPRRRHLKSSPSSSSFAAATLNSSLLPISSDLKTAQAKSTSTLVSEAIAKSLKPKGRGICDHSRADRFVNLVTCIPYSLLALRNVRRAKTEERRLYGAALTAVAFFSTTYHAVDGEQKEKWSRKLDYWSIAAASTAMGRILYPKGECLGFYGDDDEEENDDVAVVARDATSSSSPLPFLPPLPRRGRTRVSLALSPFQPFAVIAAHSLGMETHFWRRAHAAAERKARRERKKSLETTATAFASAESRHHHHHHRDETDASILSAHRLHLLSGLAGVVAFFAEDAFPGKIPFVHGAWHVMSALAMAATEPLVDDAERRLIRGRESAGNAKGRRETGATRVTNDVH